MNTKQHTPESKLLGQQVTYPQSYAPEILVAVPRAINREQYAIDSPPTEFTGYDTWHAYETGFLTRKGLPITGLLKLVYPSDSTFLVESKSLKLYLNSYNMSTFGATAEEGIDLITAQIKRDLEALLQCKITLHFFRRMPENTPFEFDRYEILEETLSLNDLVFEAYREAPELLESIETNSARTIEIGSHLLRSNCKVTHQPDWGSAFIRITGKRLPTKESLLRYLISFRNENHFHEEICEMIYKRLLDRFKPDELMVTCLYTRRGGIDICPARASHPHLLPKLLGDASHLTQKLLRQ